MKFCIISHVVHFQQNNQYFAYGPFIREMNIWEKFIDELIVISPLQEGEKSIIDLPYTSKKIHFIKVPIFSITSVYETLKAIILFPFILIRILKGMHMADHIHLRCPGNMGLLAVIIQLFFPYKTKTAKYAGNWDWNSKQPFTYRLQQRILRNTILTRNMQVLVYGEWPDRNRNIRPFFTASYSENEIFPILPKFLNFNCPIKFIFVGNLSKGKRPLLSLEVVKKMLDNKINCSIDFYGNGNEREVIEELIKLYQLQNNVFLHGNVNASELKLAYQKSNFLLFFSQSEGWPKVVAESMFWGCLPLTTSVSCVPQMVGNGLRGDILNPNADEIVKKIQYYLNNPKEYANKCELAIQWSRQFTLEKFENEIKYLII